MSYVLHEERRSAMNSIQVTSLFTSARAKALGSRYKMISRIPHRPRNATALPGLSPAEPGNRYRDPGVFAIGQR